MSDDFRYRVTPEVKKAAEETGAPGHVFAACGPPPGGIHLGQVHRVREHPVTVVAGGNPVSIITVTWKSNLDLTARPGCFLVPAYVTPFFIHVIGNLSDEEMVIMGWLPGDKAAEYPMTNTGEVRGHLVPFSALNDPALPMRKDG